MWRVSPRLTHPHTRVRSPLSIYSPFPEYLKNSTAELLGYSSINVLLVFTPLAFIAKILEWEDSITFFFALMALIPLAALLGMVTEELAMYTNQTLGGLMNATFGNATEVIISAIALVAAKPENDFAMLRIVQVSLVRTNARAALAVLCLRGCIGADWWLFARSWDRSCPTAY